MTAIDESENAAQGAAATSRPTRSRRRWLWLAGGLVALLITFVGGYAVATLLATPTLKAVPSVSGSTFEVAANRLRAEGFNNVMFAPADAVSTSAVVVVQKPAAGIMADPKTPITLEALAAQPGFNTSWLSPSYSSPSYTSPYSSPSYTSPYSSPSYTNPTPSGPVTPERITEGTYMVGSGDGELPAGTYVGACTGSLSSWTRYGSGGTDDFAGYDSIYTTGQLVVTVKQSDSAVEFSGTCSWSKR